MSLRENKKTDNHGVMIIRQEEMWLPLDDTLAVDCGL